MNRIYHPWDKWEDFKAGLYGGQLTFDKKTVINNCVLLLSNKNMFEHALARIIIEWPYSCEHNLSNKDLNRIAYLGQAACALMYHAPKTLVMEAWNMLSLDQQNTANEIAIKYLTLWETKHESTQKIPN